MVLTALHVHSACSMPHHIQCWLLRQEGGSRGPHTHHDEASKTTPPTHIQRCDGTHCLEAELCRFGSGSTLDIRYAYSWGAAQISNPYTLPHLMTLHTSRPHLMTLHTYIERCDGADCLCHFGRHFKLAIQLGGCLWPHPCPAAALHTDAHLCWKVSGVGS